MSSESFSPSSSHPIDHDISFSVHPFMPQKSVIYRYFQILKDPQYYCPVFNPTVNSKMTRTPSTPISPQSQTDIDKRIFS